MDCEVETNERPKTLWESLWLWVLIYASFMCFFVSFGQLARLVRW